MKALSAEPACQLSPKATLPWTLNLLAWNVAALILAAVLLRGWKLGNIPGINGDEGWSGVQAVRLARGEAIAWQTPTGNPINVFFLLPLAALSAVAPPSFTLLRLVPLVSGLAALVANYLLCRQAFDRRTGVVSTLILALLPLNIAYSRFAWDASQSLLATVPLVYLPIIQARNSGRVSLSAMLVFIAAIVVHPTNLFAAPLLIIPPFYQRRTRLLRIVQHARLPLRSWTLPAIVGMVALGTLATWNSLRLAVPRAHGLSEVPEFAGNYLRLLSGTAVYEFIGGVPAGNDSDWLGYLPRLCEVVLVLVALLALLGMVRRLEERRGEADASLVLGWLVMLAGFFLVAGPRAIAPHFERYGICLVAPSALVLARGLCWWLAPPAERARWRRVALVLTAWLWPVTFFGSYFQAIEHTGGDSHMTFRTAAVEPKQAAFQYVRENRVPGESTQIVCHEWWVYWPLAYLASTDPEIKVLTWDAWHSSTNEVEHLRPSRAWFVEFAGSEGEREILGDSPRAELNAGRKVFCDYAGRPLISVIGSSEKLSQNY